MRSASRHGAWSRIKGSDHSLPGTTAVNVASAGTGAFDAELVILGTSTWGCVDPQDDWAATGFVQLEAADWTGKKVALGGRRPRAALTRGGWVAAR